MNRRTGVDVDCTGSDTVMFASCCPTSETRVPFEYVPVPPVQPENISDAKRVQETVDDEPIEMELAPEAKPAEAATVNEAVGRETAAGNVVEPDAATTAFGKIALLYREVRTVVPVPEHADPWYRISEYGPDPVVHQVTDLPGVAVLITAAPTAYGPPDPPVQPVKLVDVRPVHVTVVEPPTVMVFVPVGNPAVFPMTIGLKGRRVIAVASDAAKHAGGIVKVADDDELRVTEVAQ